MRRLAVFAAAALLIGCPGNQPPNTSTTTGNPQAVTDRSAKMNPITPPSREFPSSRAPAAATPQIQVQLLEYEIRMPDTLRAGHVTFHVANAGKQNHNFVIEGNGVSQKLASDLPRGDTADLTVDLAPGTYTVFCPVDRHRGRGMQRLITVK